jgi:MFS family permease
MRSTLRRIASWTCVHVLKEKEIYVSSVVSVSDYRAGVYPGGDRRDGAARGGADIEHDAGASGNELLWIIDIYSLVMAGMVLPMGALGDRIGFKRLLMIGSTLFGLSSLAAAFAPSAGWLIAARASLAIGAAMIIPATLAGIRTLFIDARDRNIALGVWAAVGPVARRLAR